MFANTIREFADWVVDELAPPTEIGTRSDGTVRLASNLGHVSRVGADEADIMSAIVEIARARNVLDAAQSELVRAAGVAGLPFRQRVRSEAGLLIAIGVPPAVAHRTARNGQHAEDLEVIGRGTTDHSRQNWPTRSAKASAR